MTAAGPYSIGYNDTTDAKEQRMAVWRSVRADRMVMGKGGFGEDLLDEITGVCRAAGINLGRIEALGAVQKARLGYYNQTSREYEFLELDRHIEIANLVGNVSLAGGEPMVHAHVTLSDDEGRAYGGHLVQGTVIFACEFIIQELDGEALHRGPDKQTGLPLWTLNE